MRLFIVSDLHRNGETNKQLILEMKKMDFLKKRRDYFSFFLLLFSSFKNDRINM